LHPKLTHALAVWKAALWETNGREDGEDWIGCEDPNLKELLSLFTSEDEDGDKLLRWTSGEVRTFVRRAFMARSLAPPPLCQVAWLLLYHELESEGRVASDFRECIAFLVHLADTVHSLASGAGQPVEIEPHVFIMRRLPGSCGGLVSQSSFPSPKDAAVDEAETSAGHYNSCAASETRDSPREPEPESSCSPRDSKEPAIAALQGLPPAVSALEGLRARFVAFKERELQQSSQETEKLAAEELSDAEESSDEELESVSDAEDFEDPPCELCEQCRPLWTPRGGRPLWTPRGGLKHVSPRYY
jgi:hypothetical protein